MPLMSFVPLLGHKIKTTENTYVAIKNSVFTLGGQLRGYTRVCVTP